MTLDPVTFSRLQNSVWPALEVGLKLPNNLLNAIANWETRGTYDNDAINRGSGARGIFQLTPIALKQVKIDTGMNINPVNPYQASTAAAVLLARASKLFSGELPLMLIAYNSGEGNAKKFVRENAATGRGTLSRETRDYIANVVPMVS
jgi:soluble lytic murein transglycosylase-like protein